MPVPHLEIRIVQRSKGSSAVAGAAYQAGEKLFSEYDQKFKDHRRKQQEVVYTEIMLPTNAPPEYADRATLWNSAEEVEKQWNSQLARRFVVALPREVPLDMCPQMLQEYCREHFVSKGIQQARSTEKSVGDRLKMPLAGESLQELEARASAIITPVRDEETIAADIHAMCGKESIAAFIGGKNATVEGYVKEYSSTETLAAAVDSKAKERRETETRMAEMPEIPEEYLHVTEPKAYLEKLKRSEEIADAECKDALKEKTAAERDLDSYQNEMDGEDLLENCERAQRELEEQKALLKHWFHIRDVFEEQKAQLRGNPMEDITKHFARYLGLISGGKVFPEFPQTDKLDMNIYSGDRLVNYRRLSEGTKETVYLASTAFVITCSRHIRNDFKICDRWTPQRTICLSPDTIGNAAWRI